MIEPIRKYPRTHHIEGSRLQPGDEDLRSAPLDALVGGIVVIEEKLDGANAAISFTADGELRLQSRGHFLTGGHRERHFNLFKSWAATHAGALFSLLGARYIVYGEWLYAKHTIFYDRLPHYFMEFDVLDQRENHFLSTTRRRQFLADSPLHSVPVLASGPAPRRRSDLGALVTTSLYKSEDWPSSLRQAAADGDLDVERVVRETDPSPDMEGLYIKVENDDEVLDRYKFIRPTFLTSVLDSGSHWLDRPIVPNQLDPSCDLFGVT